MPPTSAGARLRARLDARPPALLLEAHNAVSARIASEAGVDAIWASSLTLSCCLGYLDDESLPLDELAQMLRAIVAHSAVPVLVDGDTGSCGGRDVQRMVSALGRIGAAGVVFEDKQGPKLNSLLPNARHMLASVEDFSRRLRLAKQTQADPRFLVVARTEALIAGAGLDAALARARAYADAGADAVLIHSKCATFDEVDAFMRRWNRSVPVLCVPTTYADTPCDVFARSGVAGVVWANHLMRSAIDAMQTSARAIVATRSAGVIEHRISSVPEIWRLQQPSASLEAAS